MSLIILPDKNTGSQSILNLDTVALFVPRVYTFSDHDGSFLGQLRSISLYTSINQSSNYLIGTFETYHESFESILQYLNSKGLVLKDGKFVYSLKRMNEY